MFEQLTEPKGRRRWSVMLAFAGQIVAVGILVLIPVLFVQTMPVPELSTVLIAPPPPAPPPPPPPPASAAQPRVAHVETKPFDPTRVYQPHVVPKTVAILPDLPQAPPSDAPATAGVPGGVAGGQVGGVIGGVLGGVLGAVPSAAAPPPPPPPPTPVAAAPAAPKVLRVGGQVQAGRVISAPRPIYPVLAKEAKVSGVVQLDIVIGPDGRVESLKVVSGPPLLVEAAMNAVRQWTYKPTILNGQPMKVQTQVIVNFTLG
jgi:periplasmic protein TonB